MQQLIVGGAVASVVGTALFNGLKQQPKICSQCQGTGGVKCFACDGTGIMDDVPLELVSSNMKLGKKLADLRRCRACKGCGMLLCKRCRGSGYEMLS